MARKPILGLRPDKILALYNYWSLSVILVYFGKQKLSLLHW